MPVRMLPLGPKYQLPAPVQYKRAREGPQCQCDPDCPSKPMNKSPFCKKHQKICTRKAPVSDATPPYDPTIYNKDKGIQESHNCYAYAMGYKHMPKKCKKNSCPVGYPQPGYKSGYPEWSATKGKRCPDIIARVLGDAPTTKLSTFEQKCPKRYRKIAIVADFDEDYHLYRQDADGYWSHKPGATEVTNVDAMGRRIYDPQLASRFSKSSNLNYDRFCGYLCIQHTNRRKLRRTIRKKR